MNDSGLQGREQVWDWKRRAEELTRGMSHHELMDFYRREAEVAERKLGVRLVVQAASFHDAAQGGRSPQTGR
ncbi:MAG: hypothetical protein HOP29_17870 [Phycisphaerales bacterium]|nr:hypothetical protein [Phycisphaerales bacterium]